MNSKVTFYRCGECFSQDIYLDVAKLKSELVCNDCSATGDKVMRWEQPSLMNTVRSALSELLSKMSDAVNPD